MSGGKQLSQATAHVAGEDEPAAKKIQRPKRGYITMWKTSKKGL